jgi:hypothetical protein
MNRLRRLAHAIDRAVEEHLLGRVHYRERRYTLDQLVDPYLSPTPTAPAGLRPWST